MDRVNRERRGFSNSSRKRSLRPRRPHHPYPVGGGVTSPEKLSAAGSARPHALRRDRRDPTGFAPRFGKEAVPLRPHSSGSGRFFSATRPTPRKPRFREEALVLRRCPGGLENKKRPSRTLPPGAIPSGSFVQGRLFCVGTGSNIHSGASALRTTHRFPASGHHCPSRFRCDVRPPAKRADAGTMAGLPQPVKPSRPSGIRPSRQLITAATPRGRAPRS